MSPISAHVITKMNNFEVDKISRNWKNREIEEVSVIDQPTQVQALEEFIGRVYECLWLNLKRSPAGFTLTMTTGAHISWRKRNLNKGSHTKGPMFMRFIGRGPILDRNILLAKVLCTTQGNDTTPLLMGSSNTFIWSRGRSRQKLQGQTELCHGITSRG